jgi:hypothetical protein
MRAGLFIVAVGWLMGARRTAASVAALPLAPAASDVLGEGS